MRTFLLLGGLCLCTSMAWAGPHGAEVNPTGDPIGGGAGYRRIVSPSQADHLVATREELLAALAAAAPGETIYVADQAEIDLSDQNHLVLPPGVTLASGRGSAPGAEGALLYSTAFLTDLLWTGGDHVRVTGLRLRGPHTETDDTGDPTSRGISAYHSFLEVDNCEIWGFAHAAVFAEVGQGLHVHHCHIHHNRRDGYGYGVCLASAAKALIEANRFDYNRHDIACTGRPGTSYEACYNLFQGQGISHSVDMHGGGDRGDGTNIAGDWLSVHDNTFDVQEMNAIVIRGGPRWRADIWGNRFVSAATAVYGTHGDAAIYCWDNEFAPGIPVGYRFAGDGGSVDNQPWAPGQYAPDGTALAP